MRGCTRTSAERMARPIVTLECGWRRRAWASPRWTPSRLANDSAGAGFGVTSRRLANGASCHHQHRPHHRRQREGGAAMTEPEHDNRPDNRANDGAGTGASNSTNKGVDTRDFLPDPGAPASAARGNRPDVSAVEQG